MKKLTGHPARTIEQFAREVFAHGPGHEVGIDARQARRTRNDHANHHHAQSRRVDGASRGTHSGEAWPFRVRSAIPRRSTDWQPSHAPSFCLPINCVPFPGVPDDSTNRDAPRGAVPASIRELRLTTGAEDHFSTIASFARTGGSSVRASLLRARGTWHFPAAFRIHFVLGSSPSWESAPKGLSRPTGPFPVHRRAEGQRRKPLPARGLTG